MKTIQDLREWYAKLSLRTRITGIAVAITTLALTVVAAAAVLQIHHEIADQEHRSADAISLSFSRAAEMEMTVGDKPKLTRLTTSYARDPNLLFIAAYDARGNLLTSAASNQTAWKNYLNNQLDPETCILSRRTVTTQDQPEELGSERDPFSAGLKTPKLIGTIVVGLSTAEQLKAQSRQNYLTVAVAALAAGIGALVLFLTLGQWMRRLQKLAEASLLISRGNFLGEIKDQSDDEIGRLAQAFDEMRGALRKRDHELRKFTDTLQEQVKERTRDLQTALTAAEDANKAKSMFLANMSHELRTPLNGVIGMVDLLLAAEPNQQQRRYCDIAKSSAHSLVELINDILDFSKIEAGKLELDETDFNLHETIDEVAQLLGERASKKGIELLCRVNPAVPKWVGGDPVRLRQVILNLASNAVKFTDKGEVIVEARLENQTPGHTEIRISVTDSGIGIPKDRLDRLFKSFSQVDASTTRKYGGTGLGLAISQRIVEMMGGKIGVESQEGKGSVFWFTVRLARRTQMVPPLRESGVDPRGSLIPAVDDSQTQRGIPHAQHAPAGRLDGVRVLLAEDNEVNRLVATELLELIGCQVSVAVNGYDAVQLALNQTFDITLMDCQMPILDGFEATRAIRKAETEAGGNQHRKIIALTANAIKGDRELCLAAGMDEYLTKPIEPNDLLRTIQSLLPADRAAKANAAESPAVTAEPEEAPSVSPQEPVPAPVDLPSLTRRCVNNRKLAAKALKIFDSGIDRDLALLAKSIQERDPKAVAASAHKIKGAAANISAEDLRNIAAELEELARADSLENSDDALESLNQQVMAFRKYLDTAITQLTVETSPETAG